MVFTRRRSAVVQEDVNAAMEAMDAVAPTKRGKRLSEVGSESSVTSRTRSPRVSTASSTSKNSTENKHLAAALSSELGLAKASPAAKIRSPRTSASSKTSEAAAPNSRPSTPTRGVANRLTEGGRPGTPTRMKRLSESVNVTPTRKSRRLSGSAPEEVDNTAVLPLKKRRASLSLAEENTRENETAECPIQSTNDTELTTIESNLEVIDENEEEEISPKKKNKTPVKTATPSKTPENKSTKKTSASSRQTPKESAKATTEKSPKSTTKEPEKVAQVKASNTPTKVASPKKTVDSPKAVIEGKVSKKVEEKASETAEKIEKNVKKSDAVKGEKKSTPMTEQELLRLLAQSLVKTIPRQKPKSGRFWKSERIQFGSLKKDKGKRIDLPLRLKMKEDKERSRDEANALILAKNKKKEEFRLKIEEAQKRKAENARKSEVVQIVKNPNKIKRMKKKDLTRRDILKV